MKTVPNKYAWQYRQVQTKFMHKTDLFKNQMRNLDILVEVIIPQVICPCVVFPFLLIQAHGLFDLPRSCFPVRGALNME